MNALTKVLGMCLMAYLLLSISNDAKAGSWNCGSTVNGPYCSYTGLIEQVYANENNLLLFYFEKESPLPITEAESVGYTGITRDMAVAVSYESEPDFSDYSFSTLFYAASQGIEISIQIRGTVGGYAKMDRFFFNPRLP